MDNTPIAKRTRVLSAFEHTFVLLSPNFDDIDNTTVHSEFPSLILQHLNSGAVLVSLMALHSRQVTKTPFGPVFSLFHLCVQNALNHNKAQQTVKI